MPKFTPLIFRLIATFCLAAVPSLASAQGLVPQYSSQGVVVFFSLIAFALVSLLLSRLWIGLSNSVFIHSQALNALEKQPVYLPSHKLMLGTILGTMAIFLLAWQVFDGVVPLAGSKPLVVGLLFVLLCGALLLAERYWRRAGEYVFAGLIGTLIAVILIGFQRALFTDLGVQDPYLVALVVTCSVLTWRALFGPWSAHIKATVLGTFIFWLSLNMLAQESADMRAAHLLAGTVALVPAVIWCIFFLKYHAQRLSLVVLMFLAGMLSTAPILFYDRLVKSGAELQFFFFRIVPENFNTTSNAFVTGNIIGIGGVQSTLMVTLLSFMFVGLVEEVSKFWVMRSSGRRAFTSIDDVMQLSIIVAIGFAFAENIINPSYFIGFLRDFLSGDTPNWGGFLGNVMGRAILTNMVHIVSTGVLGYFFGLALFAGPYIKERHQAGKRLFIADNLHNLLGYNTKLIFRREMMVIGLLLAVGLHGLFNFLVTFPDLLPTRPASIGALFNLPLTSILHQIPLLMIPSLFYVVGGFWLLTTLFYKKENMKERGHLVTTDTFVTVEEVAA